MSDHKPQPEVAFMAAALVLLVLPLLIVVGVAAFGLAASYTTSMDRVMDSAPPWLLLALFLIWVLVAVAIVLTLVARLARRGTRP